MILPLVTAYVFGRVLPKKSQAIVLGILVGAMLGLIATYTLVPLLYPVFVGDAGLVVIPEFDAVGIMFLTRDFILYSEIVYMRTRSLVIDLVFVLTGALSTIPGTWIGSAHRIRKITDPFEEM